MGVDVLCFLKKTSESNRTERVRLRRGQTSGPKGSGKEPAGQFSSFDREAQTTRSPIEQANPECRFQLFNLPAQGGLRDVERFGRLPKTSGPGDFREGH